MSEKYVAQAGIIETLWAVAVNDPSYGLEILEVKIDGVEENA